MFRALNFSDKFKDFGRGVFGSLENGFALEPRCDAGGFTLKFAPYIKPATTDKSKNSVNLTR